MTTKPLTEIKRSLTTAAGEIDRAAVEAAAVAAFNDITKRWQYRDLDAARAVYLRAAEFEQEDCADKARRNAQWAAQQEAEAIDADFIANRHGYDVASLQAERDHLHYGNSTRRSTDLPRYERALKVAQERAAAKHAKNGICSVTDRFYGAIPADDCNSSWIAVKVDRAGNRIILEEGFDTEEAAEEFAGEIHQQDLADNSQFGVGA